MNIPYAFKKCPKCGEWLVASSFNYHKDKNKKFGLCSNCKSCVKKRCLANKDKKKEYDKKYKEEHKDKYRKQAKEYYKNNIEICKERHKKYYEENKEQISYKKHEYRKKHIYEFRAKDRKRYNKNKEKYKKYYEENKEHCKEISKKYYIKNKEKLLAYNKIYKSKYMKTSRGEVKTINNYNRRRFKENMQGNGITVNQWLEMINYFDWKCAYSGESIGGNSGNRTIDHIIPISKGGEHEIWNCVPMTKSYNSSKQDKDMLEWYKQQEFYSEERLKKIRAWQEYAYNKWGKENITNGYNT